MMVACQWNISSPTGPAEQLAGGSFPRSTSSRKQQGRGGEGRGGEGKGKHEKRHSVGMSQLVTGSMTHAIGIGSIYHVQNDKDGHATMVIKNSKPKQKKDPRFSLTLVDSFQRHGCLVCVCVLICTYVGGTTV